MAYEAVMITLGNVAYGYPCANATTIEKGTLMKISGSAVAKSASASDRIKGFAAAEKIGADGVTQIAVYKSGRFKVYLSGSCLAGDPLGPASDGNNMLTKASATLSGSVIVGTAEEGGTTGQTILFNLNPEVAVV